MKLQREFRVKYQVANGRVYVKNLTEAQLSEKKDKGVKIINVSFNGFK